MSSYIPLYTTTEYSLLSSTIRINDLIQFALKNNISSLAITDDHNLFGAVEFSLKCVKNGIKPIIGVKMRIEGNRQILIYAKTKIGYENISYLLTHSYTKNKNHEVTWAKLFTKVEGTAIIAVPSMLAANNEDDLRMCGEHFDHCKAEWYVGLESGGIFDSSTAYLSEVFNKPVIAVSGAQFLYAENQEAHDALLCIKSKTYISDSNRARSNATLEILTPEKAAEVFTGFDFALTNTVKFAKQFDFVLGESPHRLPRFRIEGSEDAYLRNIALQGLEKMALDTSKYETYRQRLEYELSVISRMNYSGYFLIVSDFVKFAHSQKIPVSLRGSGAGSLVACCVDITEIDPIRFELFFERFLNPDRVSMPDFDIDFSPVGRERVINYVIEKYGSQCVAGIITFGTLASRAALKDVGRVLHMPFMKIDQLAKRIQVLFGRPFTLQETYERDPEFAKEINDDEMLKKVFQVAQQLEGLPRHASAHAAGIVITDAPLYRYCPLYQDSESSLPLVQYSMKYAELIGLVKFDFLGVTALDVLAEILTELKNDGIDLALSQIPFDDDETFAFMRGGHTRGIFQFETVGMTNLIQEMEASCIEDLVATVALYRPGPMDNIPTFIRYKKGLEQVNYIYPDLEVILQNTYGIIVYQEQILKIVQVIAGYTLAEADLFRRAIGKKIVSEMERYRQDFVARAHAKQGGDISQAESLFKLIETFANYGFNKAHAVAYAIVGYRGAYLKTHYTAHFICASLNAEQNNQDKLAELIIEARKLNIEILPPCINTSNSTFTLKDGKIAYSLRGVKNIGPHVVDLIMQNRPFSSIHDLHNKVSLNKREIESLIKGGALDCFKLNRGSLYQTWSLLADSNNNFLFSPDLFISENAQWSPMLCLSYEKEVLGLYISKHPVQLYPYKNLNLELFDNLDTGVEYKNSVGVLNGYSSKVSKNNRRFYVCNISDPDSNYECMLMDEQNLTNLKSKVIVFNLKYTNNRCVISNIRPIESFIRHIKELHIKITNETQLYLAHSILQAHRSDAGLKVYLQADKLVDVGYVSNLADILDAITQSQLDWRAS